METKREKTPIEIRDEIFNKYFIEGSTAHISYKDPDWEKKRDWIHLSCKLQKAINTIANMIYFNDHYTGTIPDPLTLGHVVTDKKDLPDYYKLYEEICQLIYSKMNDNRIKKGEIS